MNDLWDYCERVWDYRERTWTLDRDLVDYELHGSDGFLGDVVSVENSPRGAYVVVDTSATFDARRLIPAGVIASLDHDRGRVRVDLTKDQLRRAPDYSGKGWNEEIRAEHSDYYGNVSH